MGRCCLNPVNWKDEPDPKRYGWIRTTCAVCLKWLGGRPENIKAWKRGTKK